MRHAWPLWLLVFACQVATGPVDPVWGKQACAHCMMLLSDRHAAAQVQLEDGSHAYFDDIGCMVEWQDRNAHALRGQWVRSVEASGWTDAQSASYGAGHATPMDYGLLPAADGISYEAAKRIVRERSLARKEALR